MDTVPEAEGTITAKGKMTELAELHSKASEQYESLLISTSSIGTTPGSTRPSSPGLCRFGNENAASNGVESSDKKRSDHACGDDDDDAVDFETREQQKRSRIPRLKLSPISASTSALFPHYSNHRPSSTGFVTSPGTISEASGLFDDVIDEEEADLLPNSASTGRRRLLFGAGQISSLQQPVFDRFFGSEFSDLVYGRKSGHSERRSAGRLQRSQSFNAWSPTEPSRHFTPSYDQHRKVSAKKSVPFPTPRSTSVQHPSTSSSATPSTARRRFTAPSPGAPAFSLSHPSSRRHHGRPSVIDRSRRRLSNTVDARSDDACSESNLSVGAGSNMSLPVAAMSGKLPLNGTTFGHKRYLVHRCDFLRPSCEGDDKYLTPTQRAGQQVKLLKVQIKKLNEELGQRRREITDLTAGLVKSKLESVEESEEAEKPAKKLVLPDLSCFNCGYLLSLTAPTESCPCSELDQRSPVETSRQEANAETAESEEKMTKLDAGNSEGQLREDSILEANEEADHVDMAPKAAGLSLPPPSLTDSGLGKEVEHNDGSNKGYIPESPATSDASSKTQEELFSAMGADEPLSPNDTDINFDGKPASTHNEDGDSPDDFFVSFEAVEMKLRDCEAEWSRKLDAALTEKNAELERIRSKHNDKVEELLKRLDSAQTEYAKVWQKYQEAETRLEAAQVQVDSLAQALKQPQESSPARVDVATKEIQTSSMVSFSLAEDGELKISEREKAEADLREQLARAQEELTKMRALHEARRDAETSCDELEAVPASSSMTSEPAPKQETKTEAVTADLFNSDVTLQFLKSAVFYFLTDRENYPNHLRAIQNILNFNDKEKRKIDQMFHGFY